MSKNIFKKKSSKSIDMIVNEFINKICDLNIGTKTFDEKLNNISLLVDNLIDYCVKKKIFFFIENKIGYTNIVENFKLHLAKFIKNLVDPTNILISKYIISDADDNVSLNKMGWDNVSDINSVMFKNFKNLNETFEKNVSFGNDIQIVNYEEYNITNYDEANEGFELNRDICTIGNSTTFGEIEEIGDNINIRILPIYIKLLINQNKYLIEFTDKLISMCEILSNHDIKYKKLNPYD